MIVMSKKNWERNIRNLIFFAFTLTEFCKGQFSPTDMNNFPNQTTGVQRTGKSQQDPPETVSFSQKKPLSVLSLWPMRASDYINEKRIARNSASAEITKSIKITTPQRVKQVKSNYQSLDSQTIYYKLYIDI